MGRWVEVEVFRFKIAPKTLYFLDLHSIAILFGLWCFYSITWGTDCWCLRWRAMSKVLSQVTRLFQVLLLHFPPLFLQKSTPILSPPLDHSYFPPLFDRYMQAEEHSINYDSENHWQFYFSSSYKCNINYVGIVVGDGDEFQI